MQRIFVTFLGPLSHQSVLSTKYSHYCCHSVTRLSLTICEPMDCSMPGFPVLHYLQEFVQIHVRWVHPLPPSPLAFNLAQHQGLFKKSSLRLSIGASALVLVLPMNIHDWFPLGLTCLIFLQSKGLSRVFTSTKVWKHQFFGSQPSLWSYSHIRTWLPENP